jgi:hypothetical protein
VLPAALRSAARTREWPRVISWVLYKLSTVLTLIVLASFGIFAYEELRDGSNQQIAKLGQQLEGGTSQPTDEELRERVHGTPREVIDDGNDILTKPFAAVADSSSEVWVQRGLPFLLAFLAYGVLLRLLASYARRLP